ncbi:MAG: hypothetical protein EAZ06_02205 [Cytophagales bacterium]|nr:MAG: hypothetical protein EAZ06_02205 [Cytophagales bacterium]
MYFGGTISSWRGTVYLDTNNVFNPNGPLENINNIRIGLSLLSFSYHQPIKKWSDEMTLGISANVGLGVVSGGEGGGQSQSYLSRSAWIDIPIFAVYRYGIQATPKSMKDYGIGVGLGFRQHIILGSKIMNYPDLAGLVEFHIDDLNTIRFIADIFPSRTLDLGLSRDVGKVKVYQSFSLQYVFSFD